MLKSYNVHRSNYIVAERYNVHRHNYIVAERYNVIMSTGITT